MFTKIFALFLLLTSTAQAAYFPTLTVSNFNQLGIYNSSLPTLTNGSTAQLELNVNGKLLTYDDHYDANWTNLLANTARIPANLTVTSNRLLVDGSGVTQPISAASLPLPSGASIAAKQPALGTAGSSSSDVITVQGIASMTALKTDGSAVTQPISASALPLPSGASIAAKQPALGTAGSSSSDVITVQGIASMTALKVDGSAVTQPVSIASAVQTKASINANATLSPRQTVTVTESNLAAPSNAVGVIVECESVNADNLRWGFSNATSAILSSTLGVLCEPGRDTGYLPLGTGSILHLISTGGGSDFADVQWVLSQ